MKNITLTLKSLNKLLIQNLKQMEKDFKLKDLVEVLYMKHGLDSQKILKLSGLTHEFTRNHVFIENFDEKTFKVGILNIYANYGSNKRKRHTRPHIKHYKTNTYKEHRTFS